MSVTPRLKLSELILQSNVQLKGWIWLNMGNPPKYATEDSICTVVDTDGFTAEEEEHLDKELEREGFHSTMEIYELFDYIAWVKKQTGTVDVGWVVTAFNRYLVNDCWPGLEN